MDKIDKIIQLFQSNEYELAFQLAEGVGMTKHEFLEYIWNNYSNYYSKNGNAGIVQSCQFGDYGVEKEYFKKLNIYEYVVIDYFHSWYYKTLNLALDTLIQLLDLQNK